MRTHGFTGCESRRNRGWTCISWRHLWMIAVVLTGLVPGVAERLDARQDETATGNALGSMLNVRRAPAARGMGVFQASFLDKLRPESHKIQMAVVIDTTESMSNELNGIRANLPFLLDDLYQIMDGGLETALVTFSDVGQSGFPVTMASPGFSADRQSMRDIIGQLTINSGKPYFYEAIDLAVFETIDRLNWSEDEEVQRWILVLADAPPYDSAFQETGTGAKRWYETDVLIQKAVNKGINIHCLLCTSRDEESEAFQSVLDKTRHFLNRLSDETGGLLLDLSYDQVRENLAENVSGKRAEYTRIGYITQADIDQARSAVLATDSSAPAQTVRIAVLPFLPRNSLKNMFYDRPEVQIATQLRKAMRSVPGIRTVSLRQIEDQINLLESENLSDEQFIQALGLGVRADYVMYGELRAAGGSASTTMRVFGSNTLAPLAEVPASGQNLSSLLLLNLRNSPVTHPEMKPVVDRIQVLESDEQGLLASHAVFAQLDPESLGQLNSAFEGLEQAVGLPPGDSRANPLLDDAASRLEAFVAGNESHAFGRALLASCYFNQAQLLESAGSASDASDRLEMARSAIQKATRLLREGGQSIDQLTRMEIEADHHLLVEKDYVAAIDKYQKIAGMSEASPIHAALRAHWVLAGIYSGDWGVSQNAVAIIDEERSRGHLIQILAWWPESAIAKTIKRNLLWDEEDQKSRTPYHPREASLVTQSD